MGSPGRARRVLIIVENLPAPFDRRVWQQAQALRDAGYRVSIICPVGGSHRARHEVLDGIEIFRHPCPLEADAPLGYLLEYANALFWQTVLAWRVFVTRGFDVIQGCNPPDDIFIVAAPFKLLGGATSTTSTTSTPSSSRPSSAGAACSTGWCCCSSAGPSAWRTS